MTSSLLPIFALFVRAIREELKARFSMVMRTFALLAILVILVTYQSEFDPMSGPAGIALLTLLGAINFIGITLLGIATFSGVITEEKEDGNLSLMRMTRLNSLAILLGKSSARFAAGLLFLAAQIPFTLLAVTLGGVVLGQVFGVYAVLASYLFFLCNVGLLSSVVSRTTTRAVAITIFVWLMLYVLAPFLSIAHFQSHRPWIWVADYLTGIHPFADVYPFTRTGFQQNSIGFSLGAGLVCFALAWLGFERFCGGTMNEAGPVRRKPLATRRNNGSQRAWRWALLWKDFAITNGGWRGVRIRLLLYATAIGTAMWVAWDDFGGPFWRDLALCWQYVGCGGFLLEATFSAANVFARERNQQTLGTLWTTPLSLGRLAWGKVGGHLLALLPAACIWWLGACLAGDNSIAGPSRQTSTAEISTLGARQIYAFFQALLFALFAGAIAFRRWKAAVWFVVLQFLLIPYKPKSSGPAFAEEVAPVYVCAAIAFHLILIAYFSLRLRRGAVVAGLMIGLGWHLLVGGSISTMLTRGTFDWDAPTSDDQFWFLSTILIVAGAILIGKIPQLLEDAAAEE